MRGEGEGDWSPEVIFSLAVLAVGMIIVGVVLPLLDGRGIETWTWIVFGMIVAGAARVLVRHLMNRN
jgi:hypothetical protein